MVTKQFLKGPIFRFFDNFLKISSVKLFNFLHTVILSIIPSNDNIQMITFGSYDFLKTCTFYALQDYRKVCEVLKIYRRKHEKNTFIFIYVTSQKSGFQFPRATSRQSHEGPRVYITTQF